MRNLVLTGLFLPMLCGALAAPAVSAQDELQNPDRQGGERGVAPGEKGEEKPVDPNAPRAGLTRYGSLQASVRPRRLAPGQSGTATFYFVMRRQYAVLADARMELLPSPPRNGVTLGPPVAEAPDVGPAGSSLGGLSHYGDILKVTAPISVGQDTPYGTHSARVLFRLPLAERASGRQLGVYQGSALLTVPVGDPLPVFGEDRTPGARPQPAEDDASVPVGSDADPGSSGAGAVGPRAGSGAGRRADGVVEGAEPASTDGPTNPPAPEDDGLLLFAVAGLALLGIGVVLLAQKRR